MKIVDPATRRLSLLLAVALSTAGCESLDAEDVRAERQGSVDIPVPEMIGLPGGVFLMGSEVGDEDERPVRRVAVEPFAIGKYEVTVGEYRAFQEATGLEAKGCRYYDGPNRLTDEERDFDDPGFPQSDRHPVVCVSWDEAVAYTQWLSQRTGRSFRLATPEEWEYAARAGESGEAPWENPEDACRYTNLSDQSRMAAVEDGRFGESRDTPEGFMGVPCDDGAPFTQEVGSYPPNAFGLFDMLGNAWEQTTGCFQAISEPQEGSADTDWCLRRAPQGGSFLLAPKYIRYANRGSIQHDHRNFTIGFRIAEDLR